MNRRQLRARIVLDEARALGLDLADLIAADTTGGELPTVSSYIAEIALAGSPPSYHLHMCPHAIDSRVLVLHIEVDFDCCWLSWPERAPCDGSTAHRRRSRHQERAKLISWTGRRCQTTSD